MVLCLTLQPDQEKCQTFGVVNPARLILRGLKKGGGGALTKS
jgi:hypothetical protein